MKIKKGKLVEIFVNSTALAGGDWEIIAPYGEFPSADRKRIQRFKKEQAEQMVAHFNSIWANMGNMFRGVPIFHGHPDIDPKNWPDDRRLGKIVALEAREDGLYGKPEYNALGQENAEQGFWVYPSPTWLSPKTNSTIVEPDELMSIGLVNRPNIFESQPWTNSAEDQETETDIIMKEKACALLGLDPAKATDEEILAGLENLKKAADENAAAMAEKQRMEVEANEAKTKIADFDTEKQRLEQEAATAKAAEANARQIAAKVVIDSAIARGVIGEAEREVHTNSMIAEGADLEDLSKKLIEKKPEMNTGTLDLGSRKVVISNERERGAAIQEEVTKRMNANSMTYDQAYASVKKDPQFSRLFEAMKQPEANA